MKKQKRVLIASLYFSPDEAGIANYSSDIAEYFAKQGHHVTAVTGFPFYPQWLKRSNDRRSMFRRDAWRGVQILRGYVYVPRRPTPKTRIFHELSYCVFATLNFLRAGPHDIIIVLSPPLLLGAVGAIFGQLWKATYFFHVEDLQLDAATSLNMMRSSGLIRLLQRLEQYIYRRATTVGTISEQMRERILDKGVSPDKVVVIPNWYRPPAEDQVTLAADSPGIRRRLNLDEKFIVAYSGNIGVKQGLDLLVGAAQHIRDDAHFHFVIAGDGADRDRIARLIESSALPNVTLLPFLPEVEYLQLLRDADCFFVGQQRAAGDVFFPSKLLPIWASGKPTVVAAAQDSELARITFRFETGIVCAHDPSAVADALYQLRTQEDRRIAFCANSVRAAAIFDRDHVLKKLSVAVIAE